ncbi:(2Fe-2S)-binding protein [Poseidonocella sp. HB161398]|uniref:(2Fe-2S)-binding protein n=1 Tax=Poseidonocella sp. HB161398 TaxID=2320855 RepID=UPI00110A0533|nr:2Fe-2S iron-sulfur cluster-binding protein [Poseidonocella sp. HB161398]
MTLSLLINGSPHQVDAAPDMPLLYVLRDHLGLNGAKYGCGMGQCGACTVQIDGRAAYSCITPAAAVQGRRVTTIEGLSAKDGALSPLQHRFSPRR